MGAKMSDERPFHERDLYRRYVDRGIAIDAALVWFKDNDWRDAHALECAQLDWYDSDGERDKPDCTCAYGRLVKQLEEVK